VGAGGSDMSCVAQNHSIYCDTALRFLTTVAKVKDSTGCCAECLKYQPVGVGGGGQPCNIWTFCGPSGSCTLSGEGVARPAHWTNMAVGDCVLLYWPVASTGQPSISGPIAQKTSANLSYWTGARPALPSVARPHVLFQRRAHPYRATHDAWACHSRLLCIWVAKYECAQLKHLPCACKLGVIMDPLSILMLEHGPDIYASVKDRVAGTGCGHEPISLRESLVVHPTAGQP